jgi:hypothetical protein
MGPSQHGKIPLCKILHFIGGMRLLPEWERWRMHNRSKIVAVQGSPCVPTTLMLIPIPQVIRKNVKQSHNTPWSRWGRGGIAPTHSWLRHYMGVSGQRHAPAALYPQRKDPPVPIIQETGWAPELVWTQRLEEKSFAPAGDGTSITRSSRP